MSASGYFVYQFLRNVIDPERKVSFTKHSLVETNDEQWIQKFGPVVRKYIPDEKERQALFVMKKAESVEVKASVAKPVKAKVEKDDSKPVALKKKKALSLGENKAVLGAADGVDTK